MHIRKRYTLSTFEVRQMALTVYQLKVVLHWWNAALSVRRFRRPVALYVYAAHEKTSQRASENAFTWQGQGY